MIRQRFSAIFWVNALTLSRVPGVFVFMAAALVRAHGGGDGWAVTAFVFMLAASLTDLFDGLLARRLGITSEFGAHADPLADKMFYLVVLPTLVYLVAREGEAVHSISILVLTVLFLLRDQWVTFLRAIGAAVGQSGGANWIGKLRTLLSFVYCCILYPVLAFDRFTLPLAIILLGEALLILLNLLSMIIYTRIYADALRRAISPSRPPTLDK